jgi:hypothetical protein
MADPEEKRNNSVAIQIIVAIIGLVGVLAAALIGNWHQIFPEASPGPTSSGASATSPRRSASDSTRPVYSKGRLVVRGTWSYDLDSGIQTTEDGADFQWELDTAVKRYLAPHNGAGFLVVGIRDFDSLTLRELEKLHYSSQKIDGSNESYNQIPQRTVVAYKTKQGRFGKFIVDDYGRDLTIRWVTYEK